MSQTTDLQAIRNGIKVGKLPATVRTAALWYLDKLPDLYVQLEKTNESRYFDEILRHVQGMLKTIEVPSSMETLANNFKAMHERHGIPTLGLKLPNAIVVKKTRIKKKVASTGAV